MAILNTVVRIILIFVGSVLLLGGGICVATNSMFIVSSGFRGDVLVFLVLMAISAAVGAAGFGILVAAGVIRLRSRKKDESAAETGDMRE